MDNIYKHIFFIGIGGISQSGLSQICLSEGIKVSGSDKQNNEIINHLKRIGINVYLNHSAKNISGVDLIVYSGAIKENNEELIEARRQGIPCMERSEFLGYLSSFYKNRICISGVHGKTTTTGIIGSIFIKAGLNPTIHIGGESKDFNSNVKIGDKEYFITEACEYRESFLKLNPTTAVILNIEEDHPDYYKDLNSIIKAFNNFANKSQNVVIGESYKCLLERKDLITFSLNGNSTYFACNIKKNIDGTEFRVFKNGKFWAKIKSSLYGKHNVYNILSAISVCELHKIKKQDIIDGIKSFKGIKRRFDYWGKNQDTMVFHDYAHHPTEINATINMVKEYFKKPIICYFEPHTYSRTKRLFSDFLNAFLKTEFIYILPTYSAREKQNQGYSGSYLAKNIKSMYGSCKYLKGKDNVIKSIKSYYGKDVIILILGAGNIYNIKNDLNLSR